VNPIPEIEALIQAEEVAHKSLTASFEKRWPIGSRVKVFLRHGQRVASNATIIWFNGSEARVILEANKRRHGRVIEGLHSCKDVAYTAIVYAETMEDKR
jgi:hypothetical protein